jgi:hypothetical protein
VDGLLGEASRKLGKAPLGETTVQRAVALTCTESLGEATHCNRPGDRGGNRHQPVRGQAGVVLFQVRIVGSGATGQRSVRGP